MSRGEGTVLHRARLGCGEKARSVDGALAHMGLGPLDYGAPPPPERRRFPFASGFAGLAGGLMVTACINFNPSYGTAYILGEIAWFIAALPVVLIAVGVVGLALREPPTACLVAITVNAVALVLWLSQLG